MSYRRSSLGRGKVKARELEKIEPLFYKEIILSIESRNKEQFKKLIINKLDFFGGLLDSYSIKELPTLNNEQKTFEISIKRKYISNSFLTKDIHYIEKKIAQSKGELNYYYQNNDSFILNFSVNNLTNFSLNSLKKWLLFYFKISHNDRIIVTNKKHKLLPFCNSSLNTKLELDLAKLTQDKVVSYPEELTLAVKIWRLETHRDQLANNMKEAPADLELLELNNLKTYLDSNNLTDKFHFVDGIFVQYIKRGNGAKVQSGQSIWINYKGQFLNGKEFDNTYKRGQMLDFQLGKPDQVIRGFEIALSKMNEGDKVRLYLPSSYAFGGQGSSNGQVPPFTSVMYELELYKISS